MCSYMKLQCTLQIVWVATTSILVVRIGQLSYKERIQLSCRNFYKKKNYLFTIKKNCNEKYFSVKEKFNLNFIKAFFWVLFFKNYEKIKNILLFIDYIKFDPQSFDCHIFCFKFFKNIFLFSFFSSISSLRIWFNFIFISTLILIFCFLLILF